MHTILNEALSHMEPYFPHTLEAWVANEHLRTAPIKKRANPIEAVLLLRALGPDDERAAKMLPTALYLAAQLSPSSVLNGIRRADKTLVKFETGGKDSDAVRCWVLQRELISASLKAYSLVFNEGGLCRGWSGSCARYLEEEVRTREPFICWDPLGSTLTKEIEAIVEKLGNKLCGNCIVKLLQREKESREKLWETLPSMTGVRRDGR